MSIVYARGAQMSVRCVWRTVMADAAMLDALLDSALTDQVDSRAGRF